MAASAQCQLCPKGCLIAPGESGECRVRFNLDGKLTAVTYGFPCAVHSDPIEKKPFNHFLPGTRALSLATAGCNLHCANCQNWEISQENPESVEAYELPPEKLPGMAKAQSCKTICMTYTEPVVFIEYSLAAARIAKETTGGEIRSAIVTAAYVNPDPFKELCSALDAVKIDFKAFSDKFYRDVCKGSLKPVLKAMETARSTGVHLEIVNLLIPSLNDSDKDVTGLCSWIKGNLGDETPLHFIPFHPDYRMRQLQETPASTMKRARDIALSAGLKHVYVSNSFVKGGGDTYCPHCGKCLIRRGGYSILSNEIGRDGKCPACGTKIKGVWL